MQNIEFSPYVHSSKNSEAIRTLSRKISLTDLEKDFLFFVAQTWPRRYRKEIGFSPTEHIPVSLSQKIVNVCGKVLKAFWPPF